MHDDEPQPDEGPSPAPPDAIRGHIRLTGHRRVSHGLFLPLEARTSNTAEFMRELRAWRLVLPETAVFTHVTGARLLGWELPRLPEQVPVFAAAEANTSRPQRPGLIYSRLNRSTVPLVVQGVPVDLPEEILLRAARELGLIDLLILVDSARRHGHIARARMTTILDSGRPGVRMLGMAWSLSTHLADSGPETLLRLFHLMMDVPVQPQAVLLDERGNVVGHADLLIIGTKRVQEYDGHDHRDKVRQRVDLRRERGLIGAGYVRQGYTLDDLLNHPITVMHELDRLLDRPHRMARARRWQRLIENSLFSPRGRERVLNRWRRVNGIVDWSEIA